MGAFGASQERTFSWQFGHQNLGFLGYFCSPVFGVGCALFALFSAEKAAQGARVLELVAALNAEVEFVEWQPYIF
jgi:hypothetical protein